MKLEQLHQLEKIMEYGSFSEAAKHLFMSQPNLSRSISQLENEFNIQIFERTPKGIVLTRKGKEFLDYAREVLTASEILEYKFKGSNTELKEQLFIASQQLDFLYNIITKTYDSLSGRIIRSNIIETDRLDVIRLVEDRQVDIGILVKTNLDNKNFDWNYNKSKLEKYILDSSDSQISYLCVGPQSVFYDREEVYFSEVRKCSRIALDLDVYSKRDLLFSSGLSNSPRLIFVNSIPACINILLNSDAVLFVSKWTVGCFQDESIRILPVKNKEDNNVFPSGDLVWIKRAGEPLNPTATIFVKHLKEYFQAKEVSTSP